MAFFLPILYRNVNYLTDSRLGSFTLFKPVLKQLTNALHIITGLYTLSIPEPEVSIINH